MKRIIGKYRINWSWFIIFGWILIFTNLFYIYNIILSPIVIFFFIPVLILDIMLFPLLRSIITRKYYSLIIYDKGIQINNKYLYWRRIKSISFQTGRLEHKTFYKDHKLPVYQKIFILDKKGKEYSCIIDIDYATKKNRHKNNLRLIKAQLHDMKKVSLLSDWAEKR